MTALASHRLLLVTPFAPSRDASHGAARALGGLAAEFARRVPTAVVHVGTGGRDVVDPGLEADLQFVRSVPPSPRRGPMSRSVSLVRGAPLWTQEWWSPSLRQVIETVIDHWHPDIVQVELGVMAPAVALVANRGTPTVFVVHEPARSMSTPSRSGRALAALERRTWRHVEHRAVRRATRTVVFTERDRELLVAPDADIEVIPLGAAEPPPYLVNSDRGEGDLDHVVFVGGSSHPPNVDAVGRLVHHILPRLVERRPDVCLVLVGDLERDLSCPCPDPNCAHLRTTGVVHDAMGAMANASVVLAPLRLGGGMRVKVLDALSVGAVVVGTSIALVGLEDAVAAGAARRADTDLEIVETVLTLLDDPCARRAMRDTARDWMRRHGTWGTRVESYLRLHREILAGTDGRPGRAIIASGDSVRVLEPQ